MQLIRQRLGELRSAHRVLAQCDARLLAAVKAHDAPGIAKAMQERDSAHSLWEAVLMACEEELKRLADLNSPLRMTPQPRPKTRTGAGKP